MMKITPTTLIAGLTAVLVAGAAQAPQARAQDGGAGLAALQACYDTQTGRGDDADYESCIGLAVDPCLAETGGDLAGDWSECAKRELAFWDADMNRVYEALMARAKAADAAAPPPAGTPAQADTLRDMQRNWLAFRDAACSYERARWSGGTLGNSSAVQCVSDMTAQQDIRLLGYTRADAMQ